MASISAGVGPVIGWRGGDDVHEAHEKLLLRRDCGQSGREIRLAIRMTIQPGPDRHAHGKNSIAAEPERRLLPQHDQGIGAIGHPPPLRVVVGLELPGLAASSTSG